MYTEPAPPLARSLMYRTSFASGDQVGRTLEVSPNVIRENGPSGSRLTQMSRRPSRWRPTATDFPSGDRYAVSITPWGSHPLSTGLRPPSRFTHTTRREPRVPPVV